MHHTTMWDAQMPQHASFAPSSASSASSSASTSQPQSSSCSQTSSRQERPMSLKSRRIVGFLFLLVCSVHVKADDCLIRVTVSKDYSSIVSPFSGPAVSAAWNYMVDTYFGSKGVGPDIQFQGQQGSSTKITALATLPSGSPAIQAFEDAFGSGTIKIQALAGAFRLSCYDTITAIVGGACPSWSTVYSGVDLPGGTPDGASIKIALPGCAPLEPNTHLYPVAPASPPPSPPSSPPPKDKVIGLTVSSMPPPPPVSPPTPAVGTPINSPPLVLSPKPSDNPPIIISQSPLNAPLPRPPSSPPPSSPPLSPPLPRPPPPTLPPPKQHSPQLTPVPPTSPPPHGLSNFPPFPAALRTSNLSCSITVTASKDFSSVISPFPVGRSYHWSLFVNAFFGNGRFFTTDSNGQATPSLVFSPGLSTPSAMQAVAIIPTNDSDTLYSFLTAFSTDGANVLSLAGAFFLTCTDSITAELSPPCFAWSRSYTGLMPTNVPNTTVMLPGCSPLSPGTMILPHAPPLPPMPPPPPALPATASPPGVVASPSLSPSPQPLIQQSPPPPPAATALPPPRPPPPQPPAATALPPPRPPQPQPPPPQPPAAATKSPPPQPVIQQSPQSPVDRKSLPPPVAKSPPPPAPPPSTNSARFVFQFYTNPITYITPRQLVYNSDAKAALSAFWLCDPATTNCLHINSIASDNESSIVDFSINIGSRNYTLLMESLTLSPYLVFGANFQFGTNNRWFYDKYSIQRLSVSDQGPSTNAVSPPRVIGGATLAPSVTGGATVAPSVADGTDAPATCRLTVAGYKTLPTAFPFIASSGQDWALSVNAYFGTGTFYAVDPVTGTASPNVVFQPGESSESKVFAHAEISLSDLGLQARWSTMFSNRKWSILAMAKAFRLSCTDSITAEMSANCGGFKFMYTGDMAGSVGNADQSVKVALLGCTGTEMGVALVGDNGGVSESVSDGGHGVTAGSASFIAILVVVPIAAIALVAVGVVLRKRRQRQMSPLPLSSVSSSPQPGLSQRGISCQKLSAMVAASHTHTSYTHPYPPTHASKSTCPSESDESHAIHENFFLSRQPSSVASFTQHAPPPAQAHAEWAAVMSINNPLYEKPSSHYSRQDKDAME